MNKAKLRQNATAPQNERPNRNRRRETTKNSTGKKCKTVALCAPRPATRAKALTDGCLYESRLSTDRDARRRVAATVPLITTHPFPNDCSPRLLRQLRVALATGAEIGAPVLEVGAPVLTATGAFPASA